MTTVLHILDHSLPLMSGYSTRSRNIVVFQRELGLRPVVLTSPKHTASAAEGEVLEGIPHYRTPPAPRWADGLPYIGQIRLMARLAGRIAEVVRAEGVRVLHAHSPVLKLVLQDGLGHDDGEVHRAVCLSVVARTLSMAWQ